MTLISRARRTPTASGSSTVRPQPGMTPTRAWVSAKRARSEATRKSHVERQLEAARDGDAVDGADHRLAWSRGRGGSARRRRWRTGVGAPSRSVPSSLRSTPAQNAGSAPVSTMTSTSSRASARRDRLRQRRGERGIERVARLGPVEGDDRDAVAHLDQDHVLGHRLPTFPSIGARASRRTRPCLRGCRRWRDGVGGGDRRLPPELVLFRHGAFQARRLARAPTGPTAQMRAASASASVTASPGSLITFTNPSAYARSGDAIPGEQHLLGDVERQRPRGAEQAAARGHQAPLHLGDPNDAVLAATTRSHDSTISNPPPSAGPSTAAISGFSRSRRMTPYSPPRSVRALPLRELGEVAARRRTPSTSR